MTYETDGTIRAYRNGRPYGRAIKKSELVEFKSNEVHVLFGLRHSPSSADRLWKGAIERAQLYDRALTESEIQLSFDSRSLLVSSAEIEKELDMSAVEHLANLRFELEHAKTQLDRIQDSRVYAVVSKEPTKTFVLNRGNPGEPLQEVSPNGIAAISGVDFRFQLDERASDQERRSQLAKWITDSKNPLFSRVIVNRVWQYHFGVGIVDTPNDFGFNGGRPSHPDLLDWLAQDFIDHGWSLKHLHKRIADSKTYQQSSKIISSRLAKDAGNRLLWRKSLNRLDAESLRDTMLDLAGLLDRSVDGPGAYDFTFFVDNSHFYKMRDPIGESFQRRTLYRTWIRSGRNNLLDVFDCPDPSTKTPIRTSTTTPLQSLSLMNNSFVLRMAEGWAERAIVSGCDTTELQIQFLFRSAFFREPTAEELQACVVTADSHGLAAVTRVLLNSNELLYVD